MNQDLADCIVAPPGWYVKGVAAVSLAGKCAAGYYCTGGATSRTACNGTEDGESCQNGGACSRGDYCLAGQTYKQPCPPGHYCANGKNITGKCSSGYYCTLGAWTPQPTSASEGGNVCPTGHYCPKGSSTPVACGPGFYSSATGNKNADDCKPLQYCQIDGDTISKWGVVKSGRLTSLVFSGGFQVKFDENAVDITSRIVRKAS